MKHLVHFVCPFWELPPIWSRDLHIIYVVVTLVVGKTTGEETL